MQFPKGTKFQAWSLHQEKQKSTIRPVIRRWARLPDGSQKIERLSTEKYKHLRDDPEELRKFVIRLNEQVNPEERTKTKVEIKHAFIDPKMLDDYRDYLTTQIPTRDKALCEFTYLTRYFLNFFINELNLPDPLEWHKRDKTEWATFLLSDKAPASAGTKREIVAASNRFMVWLHARRPDEVKPLKFQPISKAVYKKVEADRDMRGETHHPKPITDKDWKVIKKNLVPEIEPFVFLGYFYGLRRAETLGVKVGDTKKAYLSVERQLESLEVHKPLKGREFRKVPHWFAEPSQVYTWIDKIIHNGIIIHPDTLTDRWNEMMAVLELDYSFHDLRHTFISKAVAKYPVREVQLAAGHKDIKTTMGYAHDLRELDDEEFIPEAG